MKSRFSGFNRTELWIIHSALWNQMMDWNSRHCTFRKASMKLERESLDAFQSANIVSQETRNKLAALGRSQKVQK